ncbi:hypothetical protein [Undibacterium sp. TC4M20W]
MEQVADVPAGYFEQSNKDIDVSNRATQAACTVRISPCLDKAIDAFSV